MDTSSYLQSQGWKGEGHSLGNGRGLKRPILVSNKQDVLGIGVKKAGERVSDQWWMRAFDNSLQGLEVQRTTKTTVHANGAVIDEIVVTQTKSSGLALNSISLNPGSRWHGLYGGFIAGTGLDGTMEETPVKLRGGAMEFKGSETTTKAVLSEPAPMSKEEKKRLKQEKKEKKALKKEKKEKKQKSEPQQSEAIAADDTKSDSKKRKRSKKSSAADTAVDENDIPTQKKRSKAKHTEQAEKAPTAATNDSSESDDAPKETGEKLLQALQEELSLGEATPSGHGMHADRLAMIEAGSGTRVKRKREDQAEAPTKKPRLEKLSPEERAAQRRAKWETAITNIGEALGKDLLPAAREEAAELEANLAANGKKTGKSELVKILRKYELELIAINKGKAMELGIHIPGTPRNKNRVVAKRRQPLPPKAERKARKKEKKRAKFAAKGWKYKG